MGIIGCMQRLRREKERFEGRVRKGNNGGERMSGEKFRVLKERKKNDKEFTVI